MSSSFKQEGSLRVLYSAPQIGESALKILYLNSGIGGMYIHQIGLFFEDFIPSWRALGRATRDDLMQIAF